MSVAFCQSNKWAISVKMCPMEKMNLYNWFILIYVGHCRSSHLVKAITDKGEEGKEFKCTMGSQGGLVKKSRELNW